jgi:hypothetical protein
MRVETLRVEALREEALRVEAWLLAKSMESSEHAAAKKILDEAGRVEAPL